MYRYSDIEIPPSVYVVWYNRTQGGTLHTNGAPLRLLDDNVDRYQILAESDPGGSSFTGGGVMELDLRKAFVNKVLEIALKLIEGPEIFYVRDGFGVLLHRVCPWIVSISKQNHNTLTES